MKKPSKKSLPNCTLGLNEVVGKLTVPILLWSLTNTKECRHWWWNKFSFFRVELTKSTEDIVIKTCLRGQLFFWSKQPWRKRPLVGGSKSEEGCTNNHYKVMSMQIHFSKNIEEKSLLLFVRCLALSCISDCHKLWTWLGVNWTFGQHSKQKLCFSVEARTSTT